jgi:hypothetical protein
LKWFRNSIDSFLMVIPFEIVCQKKLLYDHVMKSNKQDLLAALNGIGRAERNA